MSCSAKRPLPAPGRSSASAIKTFVVKSRLSRIFCHRGVGIGYASQDLCYLYLRGTGDLDSHEMRAGRVLYVWLLWLEKASRIYVLF